MKEKNSAVFGFNASVKIPLPDAPPRGASVFSGIASFRARIMRIPRKTRYGRARILHRMKRTADAAKIAEMPSAAAIT